LEDFALGVVAENAHIDEAAQVELLRPELGHDGRTIATVVMISLQI
jgi:hypothetical protein